jgi:hypothetical protein
MTIGTTLPRHYDDDGENDPRIINIPGKVADQAPTAAGNNNRYWLEGNEATTKRNLVAR